MRYLSVFSSDQEILKAASDIYLRGKWFDLDCTYSKGIFWDGIKPPKWKSDIFPQDDSTIQDDTTELKNFKDKSLESIVFDPPFLFRNRKSVNYDIISKRFTFFKTYGELQDMYRLSLDCFKRKLKRNGWLFFKCQDMTDNKFYCTHNAIINYAEKIGFELKDIIIKSTNSKKQRDAKQQNCVGKSHCYWLVFRNKARKG